jgi:hypothetical protein
MQAQTATDHSLSPKAEAHRTDVPPGRLPTLIAKALSASVGVLGCLALAACQQGIEAAGRKVDAPGVPVALVGVEGAPAALQAEVDNQVATQASARRIELVSGAEQPRYRLRGYLTAYPTENGETALAFVWDVFDSSKQRAQRVTTTTVAKGGGGDPWSQIGETQIEKATSQSMNEVAAFLAGSTAAGSGEKARPAPAMALSEQ